VVILSYNFDKIKVIPAEKENETHKKGVWKVFNENIEVNIITHEPVPYEEHCKWWENVFEKEYVYIIQYQSTVCGYIRLTKKESNSKEKNVISISLVKKCQSVGIGTHAYKLFENEMKEIGVTQIVALTVMSNKIGQKFFEKNKYIMTGLDEVKNFKRYIKDL